MAYDEDLADRIRVVLQKLLRVDPAETDSLVREAGVTPVQHRGPSQAAEIGLRVRPWLSYPTNSRSLSRVSSSVESAIDRSGAMPYR